MCAFVCLCNKSRATRGGSEANNGEKCEGERGRAVAEGKKEEGMKGEPCQATKFCAAKLPHSEAERENFVSCGIFLDSFSFSSLAQRQRQLEMRLVHCNVNFLICF